MQARTGHRARAQPAPAGDRRGDLYPCRPGLHDGQLYRHEEAQSDRPPQRLLLFQPRRNIRAQVRGRSGEMNEFDAAVSAFAIFAIVTGFMSGLLRSLATILGYLIAAPIVAASTPQIMPF